MLQLLVNCSSLGPSHVEQFFKNSPSMGPFHGVQSFRNRWLQRGSSTGSQALPANLLRCRLLSPRVHRSWQEPSPVPALHGVMASFRHPLAPAWGPFHGLQVDICSTVDLYGLQGYSLPHRGLHHRLQGISLCFSIWSTSSPSFFTDLGVCRVVSLTSPHSSLSTDTSLEFFFPLNMLSQRHYHHR